MKKILCVTNRTLCRGDFLERIKAIARTGLADIILREKDLEPAAYKQLAAEAVKICDRYGVPCILHTHAEVVAELGQPRIHLPLPELRSLSVRQKSRFAEIGTSCHSIEEVREAESLGCTYIIAGHIFETDCKKGLPGRGIRFLREAIAATDLPVYAIGGISPDNAAAVMEAGAAGICTMSGIMQCGDAGAYLKEL